MTNEELISDIKRNFDEIEKADKRQMPILVNTILRQISRVRLSDNQKKTELLKALLNLKNLLNSENQLAEMSKSTVNPISSFGESFLKSLNILRDDLFKLLDEV